ncbi:MAG: YIP1 family protein [Boseongicola sp.]|nr:YIP1 family protein [Boseongicola sp.]MDD9977557.1 YIP1 family protein [Boseongicola sp.]
MSVAQDIVRTYRAPKSTLRKRIGDTEREDRALAVLMGACVIMFVAQWPRLSREAHLNETITFDSLLAGALFGWVLMAPLLFYVLAWISHMMLKVLGSPASGYEARMALFWALLAATPLWLLTGLVAGFIGSGPALTITGVLALAAFAIFWLMGLAEIARRPNESRV